MDNLSEHICKFVVTYKDRKSKTRYYVLLENTTVLGVFGNLKKVCDFMEDKDFPSYSTIVKKKKNRIDHKQYSLQKVKIY